MLLHRVQDRAGLPAIREINKPPTPEHTALAHLLHVLGLPASSVASVAENPGLHENTHLHFSIRYPSAHW